MAHVPTDAEPSVDTQPMHPGATVQTPELRLWRNIARSSPSRTKAWLGAWPVPGWRASAGGVDRLGSRVGDHELELPPEPPLGGRQPSGPSLRWLDACHNKLPNAAAAQQPWSFRSTIAAAPRPVRAGRDARPTPGRDRPRSCCRPRPTGGAPPQREVAMRPARIIAAVTLAAAAVTSSYLAVSPPAPPPRHPRLR